MRTGAAERRIESTFTGRKTKFTIAHSAKAFQILSSNLYTDKPLAILRELSCNALDAHRDANNKETPFRITLPTSLNPSLEIRDYGTGMTPDKIETQYNSVFWSDKNHSNDDVGGLGLGSKTPFSYTDTFTLISYIDGTKHTWLCFLDAKGEPTTDYVSAVDTEEPNGIHYMIPVKNEDFNIFREKAQQALRYFPEGSYKINCDVPAVTYKIKADEYGIRDHDGSYYARTHSEQRVIMGPVAYRLDKSALGNEISRKYDSLLDKHFDFFCNIGDIDIQASREALSYDKSSIKQIVTVLDRVSKRIAKDLSDKIAQETTYIDALIKAKEITQGFSSGVLKQLRWRARPLTVDTDDITWKAKYSSVNHNSLTRSDALKMSYSTYFSHKPEQIKEAVFCHIDPTAKLNNVRLKKWIRDNPNKTMFVFQNEQDMMAVMAKYELFDSIATGDLPLPSKAINDKTQQVITKTPVKIKMRASNHSVFYEEDSDIEALNKMENVCWVQLYGSGDTPYKDPDDRSLHTLLEAADISFKCVGIPASLKHKVKLLTIPPMKEFARAKIIEFLTEESIREGITHAPKGSDRYIKSCMKDKWKKLDLYKQLALGERKDVVWAKRWAPEMCRYLGWKFNVDGKHAHPLDTMLKGKYKILTYANHMYSFTERTNFVNDALKLIEGETT